MKGFDWEEFKKGKVIVHCEKEEIADGFLKQASEHGLKWRDGSALSSTNRYATYEERTCYGVMAVDGSYGMVYCNKYYYENGGYIIVEWEPEENK